MAARRSRPSGGAALWPGVVQLPSVDQVAGRGRRGKNPACRRRRKSGQRPGFRRREGETGNVLPRPFSLGWRGRRRGRRSGHWRRWRRCQGGIGVIAAEADQFTANVDHIRAVLANEHHEQRGFVAKSASETGTGRGYVGQGEGGGGRAEGEHRGRESHGGEDQRLRPNDQAGEKRTALEPRGTGAIETAAWPLPSLNSPARTVSGCWRASPPSWPSTAATCSRSINSPIRSTAGSSPAWPSIPARWRSIHRPAEGVHPAGGRAQGRLELSARRTRGCELRSW